MPRSPSLVMRFLLCNGTEFLPNEGDWSDSAFPLPMPTLPYPEIARRFLTLAILSPQPEEGQSLPSTFPLTLILSFFF